MKPIQDTFYIENGFNEPLIKIGKQEFVHLKTIKALSRMTCNTIYVVDYQKKVFEYVSNNPLFLCGHSAKTVKKMGFDFYLKYVAKADLNLLLKINTVWMDFFTCYALKRKKKYAISCDFHLIDQQGSSNLVHQETIPLFLNDKGEIGKAISVVSLSQAQNPGNIKISTKGDAIVYTYNLKGGFWQKEGKVCLTAREKDIIRLAARGYTMKEISQLLFISFGTVKFHRRNVFDKLGVKTMTEAVMYVMQNRLV
ncbi:MULTISPECIES: response regulator transcription factor [unclassified Myroides]|uniref:response regulator transcription factor n=1 Tax=unclassified Myroides TaxID=2642485 RepID=UPI003D2F5FC3